jgi:hypothetical protein
MSKVQQQKQVQQEWHQERAQQGATKAGTPNGDGNPTTAATTTTTAATPNGDGVAWNSAEQLFEGSFDEHVAHTANASRTTAALAKGAERELQLFEALEQLVSSDTGDPKIAAASASCNASGNAGSGQVIGGDGMSRGMRKTTASVHITDGQKQWRQQREQDAPPPPPPPPPQRVEKPYGAGADGIAYAHATGTHAMPTVERLGGDQSDVMYCDAAGNGDETADYDCDELLVSRIGDEILAELQSVTF